MAFNLDDSKSDQMRGIRARNHVNSIHRQNPTIKTPSLPSLTHYGIYSQ